MKWLFGLFFSLVLILILAFSAVLTVWLKPEIILTEARLNHLLDYSAGNYFSKLPSQFNLGLKPFGFSGKHLVLEANEFCLKEPEACFKKIHVEVSFKIGGLTRIKIFEVGPIEIQNESLIYQVTSTQSDPKSDAQPSTLGQHITVSDHVLVKNFLIEFPNLKVKTKKEIIAGSLSINGKDLTQITLKMQAESNQGLDAHVLLHTAFEVGKESPFNGNISFHDHVKINGNLQGQINWQVLEGAIGGSIDVNDVMPWINTISLKNIQFERHAHRSKIDADIETKLDQVLASGRSKSVMPRVKLDTTVRGKLQATEEKGTLHYQLELGPTHDQGILMDALLGGQYPCPKGTEYRYGIERVYFNFQIPVFADLVHHLRLTNYAIPAPFSALKGSVALKVNQPDGRFLNDQIPVVFKTNLDSSEQTFKTDSQATLQFRKTGDRIKVDGSTHIDSFRFTLPDLKVLEPAPIIKNDSRLMSGSDVNVLKKKPMPLAVKSQKSQIDEEDDAPSKIDLTWKVTTAPSGIRVFHPILKPNAAAEVTWTISDQPHGSLELRPFDIEYLKRGAEVKKLRFYQNAGDPNFHYEGKLVVKKTDYTIFIEIIQDGEKPKVVLSSNPPLEDSDIVSVLLFNQTTAQLDSTDQNSSVASTQAAVANRALGLFSILALSSTPIEAVNFNPATGVYSARVKLANGLTATVGTDWDKSQEVALRKRLGRNFVLSTILQNNPDTNTETRKTLIEWFKRF